MLFSFFSPLFSFLFFKYGNKMKPNWYLLWQTLTSDSNRADAGIALELHIWSVYVSAPYIISLCLRDLTFLVSKRMPTTKSLPETVQWMKKIITGCSKTKSSPFYEPPRTALRSPWCVAWHGQRRETSPWCTCALGRTEPGWCGSQLVHVSVLKTCPNGSEPAQSTRKEKVHNSCDTDRKHLNSLKSPGWNHFLLPLWLCLGLWLQE